MVLKSPFHTSLQHLLDEELYEYPLGQDGAVYVQVPQLPHAQVLEQVLVCVPDVPLEVVQLCVCVAPGVQSFGAILCVPQPQLVVLSAGLLLVEQQPEVFQSFQVQLLEQVLTFVP